MTKFEDQMGRLSTALDGIASNVAVMSPEVTKISGESTAMVEDITKLREMLQNTIGLSDEQSASLDAMVARAEGIQASTGTLAAAVKAVDDLVPDLKAPDAPASGGDTSGSGDQSSGSTSGDGSAPKDPPVSGGEQSQA